MLPVEHNAVLIVIHIGRILESPFTSVDGDGNNPVVVPGGMVGPARVAHVLHTELALGVAALLGQLGRRDGLGILLRLGQIHRHVQRAVAGLGGPLHIPADAVAPYVVGILAQLIIKIRGLLGRVLVVLPELPNHLAGPGHQTVHQPGVKEIPVNHTVIFQNPCLVGVIQKLPENVLQLPGFHIPCGLLILVHAHNLQDLVPGIDGILLCDKSCFQPVIHQAAYCVVNHL